MYFHCIDKPVYLEVGGPPVETYLPRESLQLLTVQSKIPQQVRCHVERYLYQLHLQWIPIAANPELLQDDNSRRIEHNIRAQHYPDVYYHQDGYLLYRYRLEGGYRSAWSVAKYRPQSAGMHNPTFPKEMGVRSLAYLIDRNEALSKLEGSVAGDEEEELASQSGYEEEDELGNAVSAAASTRSLLNGRKTNERRERTKEPDRKSVV